MRSRVVLTAAALAACLVAAAPAAADPTFGSSRLLVRYDAASAVPLAAAEAALGATFVGGIEPLGVRILQVRADRAARALAALRANPAVRFAELDTAVQAEEVTPSDSLWGYQWGFLRSGVSRAWDRSVGSSAVVVAVLDTGVDSTHPDLQGKLVAGYDIVGDDADPQDDHGHGTAVAGIVGAATHNGVGIAGVCWRCPVMPVKVLDAAGAGTDSQLAAGIVWAVDHGARILNMSLGGEGSSSTLSAAVQYAHARGAVLVAAAGNDGSTTPTYPAAYPEVIAVAGTDENDQLYPWSNRGPWVALAAPGTNAATWPGGAYRSFSGTSSAAPVVAGIAGLALAASPGASAADVVAALTSTAAPVADVASGRVDAAAALSRLAPVVVAPPAPVPAPAPAAKAAEPRIVDVKLGPVRQTRSIALRVAAGRTTAVVVAPRGVHLSLTLRDASGRVLARAAGAGRVRLERNLTAGTYHYVVAARPARLASFRLSLTQRP